MEIILGAGVVVVVLSLLSVFWTLRDRRRRRVNPARRRGTARPPRDRVHHDGPGHNDAPSSHT